MNPLHQTEKQRFEYQENGDTAYLSYHSLSGSLKTFEHTIVPPSLGGRGIGSLLVEFALNHAREQNWRVKATCPFVAKFIEKHPQYRDVLADENPTPNSESN